MDWFWKQQHLARSYGWQWDIPTQSALAERSLGFPCSEEGLTKLIRRVPVAFLDPPFSFWRHVIPSLLDVAAMPGNAALLSWDQAPARGEGGSWAGVQDCSQFGLPSLVPHLSWPSPCICCPAEFLLHVADIHHDSGSNVFPCSITD